MVTASRSTQLVEMKAFDLLVFQQGPRGAEDVLLTYFGRFIERLRAVLSFFSLRIHFRGFHRRRKEEM